VEPSPILDGRHCNQTRKRDTHALGRCAVRSLAKKYSPCSFSEISPQRPCRVAPSLRQLPFDEDFSQPIARGVIPPVIGGEEMTGKNTFSEKNALCTLFPQQPMDREEGTCLVGRTGRADFSFEEL